MFVARMLIRKSYGSVSLVTAELQILHDRHRGQTNARSVTLVTMKLNSIRIISQPRGGTRSTFVSFAAPFVSAPHGPSYLITRVRIW